MKIQKVKIKSFKHLKDLDTNINGLNFWIKGENTIGKSTFMQFVEICLGSKEALPTNVPIDGEIITTKDGKEYNISVQYEKGKPKLTIKCDGLTDTSKGAVANLVGKIDFNIDEFVSLSGTAKGRKDQVEMYKELLDEDTRSYLRKVEYKIKADEEERTELGRKIKTLSGFIKENPLFGEDLDIESMEASTIQLELEQANKLNEQIKKVQDNQQTRIADIAKWEDEIKHLQAQIYAAKTLCEQAEEWSKKNTPIDTAPIVAKFDTISEHNKKAQMADEQKNKIKQMRVLEEQYGELTALIDSSRQSLIDTVRDLSPVVDGLYFDAEQLLYKGIPVSTQTLATSEIIEIGYKMKVAQNPNVGVLFVEQGESLGEEKLQALLSFAEKNDLQVFIEHVVRGQKEITFEVIGED